MNVHVLWVEDEPDSLRYERKLANRGGWHIMTATTVEEAAARLTEVRYDIVVVDLILPMDERQRSTGHVSPEAGMALIEEIRTRDRAVGTPTRVPILVITAVVSPDWKLKVMQQLYSPKHFLCKPVSESAFRGAVEDATMLTLGHGGFVR